MKLKILDESVTAECRVEETAASPAMPEISEAHDSDSSNNASKAPPKPEYESDFDPKSMRKTKPGLKRLFLTISVLFSFLLGPPLNIKTQLYNPLFK